MTLKELRAAIRAVRAKGIKRSSFMNGGHTPESYRLNARMFELETAVKKVTGGLR